ncbi:unnamed protein product [Auanema sp. JU1783]|nr:unnamed protein product [Auanema sp. JU1783]
MSPPLLGRISSSVIIPTANNPFSNSIHSTARVVYPLLIFMSLIAPSVANGGRCFILQKGLSIDGGNYRRIRELTHKECALECRDDPSCLAYEFSDDGSVCYLKARSLSGGLTKKQDTFLGFCLDENDEIRDRFRDHVVTGPQLATKANCKSDDCRDYCLDVPGAVIYSWTPDDSSNDESDIGTCSCIESLRSVNLEFNSFAGILPPKRHARRLENSLFV